MVGELGSKVNAFRERVVGTAIRGQKVRGVELVVECDDEVRFFLSVVFEENPVTGESPERNLLQRVFSEIPWKATILTRDSKYLDRMLDGAVIVSDAQWRLSDEIGDEGRFGRES